MVFITDGKDRKKIITKVQIICDFVSFQNTLVLCVVLPYEKRCKLLFQALGATTL